MNHSQKFILTRIYKCNLVKTLALGSELFRCLLALENILFGQPNSLTFTSINP